MQIRVVTGEGQQVAEPFLVRLGGWTEERYLAEAPEDRLWEFQDGELIVHSPATPAHQRIVGFLTFLLKGFIEERGLGEVFNGPAVLRLRPGADKEPDLFFVRREDAGRIGPDRVAVVMTGRLDSKAVPGFWLDVARLCEEPLRSAPAFLREILAT